MATRLTRKPNKRDRAVLRARKESESTRTRSKPSEAEILAIWEKGSRYERESAEVEKNKKLLRQKYPSWLTRREIESLWTKSDKYPVWERTFIETVEAMRSVGQHSAERMELRFGQMGFRTLGGLKLDARLIFLLRDRFRCEGKMHSPRKYKKNARTHLEPRNKQAHKAQFKYRSMNTIKHS